MSSTSSTSRMGRIARAWASGDLSSGTPDQGAGYRDRVIRDVLDRWDFQDSDGWRSILQQGLGSVIGETGLLDELEAALSRFAQSDLWQELARSVKRYRNVEYLYRMTGEESDGEDQCSPALQGVVDFLWQDEDRGWHLADVTASDTLAIRSYKAALVLAAEALRPRLGGRPVDISLFDLASGVLTRWPGNRLPHRQVAMAIRKALRSSLELPISD